MSEVFNESKDSDEDFDTKLIISWAFLDKVSDFDANLLYYGLFLGKFILAWYASTL